MSLATLAPTASAQRRRIIVVEPFPVGPVFYPGYYYPYPGYLQSYMGYVKIKTDRKNAAVYLDGGYAGRIEEAKKFALPPGNHNLELRDSDGQSIFQEKVAVTSGKTTKIHVA